MSQEKDDASAEGPNSHSTKPPKRHRFRWKIGTGILFVGFAFLLVNWIRFSGDRSSQIMYVYFAGMPTLILTIFWLVSFSGLPRRTRRGILTGVVVTAVLFLAMFRHEGFSGEFVPEFSLRWQPTAEERASRFRTSADSAVATKNANGSQIESTSGSESPLEITDGDWAHFRGPTRDGIVLNADISRDWSSNPPKAVWKHPIGLGWGSFAIVGDFAFTQEQRGEEEAVVCYDFETGRQLWAHSDTARFARVMSGDGPRGTPTVFDSRVYTVGATGVLNCLQARTGKLLWTTNILDDAGVGNVQWGMSASPLVYNDVVVVNPGGGQGGGVAAYHRVTGEKLWADGTRVGGYSAPRLETIGGLRQILIFGGDGLAGHDAATGQELWWFKWKNIYYNNCTQPILVGDNRVFISTGYGTGSALLDIEQNADGWSAIPTGWETTKRFRMKFNGGVLKSGYVYGLDEGVLTCFDLESGKPKWKRGRYGFGQLLLFDDVLLVLSDKGELALVAATPKKYREITRFQAIEGKTWNHPAYSRGRLLVRNAQEAACFDLRPIPATASK